MFTRMDEVEMASWRLVFAECACILDTHRRSTCRIVTYTHNKLYEPRHRLENESERVAEEKKISE